MFSYQTAVGFLVFVAGILFLFVKLRKWTRIGGKIAYAWLVNKVSSSAAKMLKPRKDVMFQCLHEMKNKPLKIVEIGAGPGTNFKYLPKNTEIICVEPNEHFKDYLQSKVAEFPEMKVVFQLGVAENLSFIASESVDAVISTHVLCSVNDLDQSLKEIQRILKKDGKFIFLEHIEAEKGSWMHFGQHLLNSPWRYLFHNCYLVRNTDIAIRKANFRETDMEIFKLDYKSKIFNALVALNCGGIATK